MFLTAKSLCVSADNHWHSAIIALQSVHTSWPSTPTTRLQRSFFTARRKLKQQSLSVKMAALMFSRSRINFPFRIASLIRISFAPSSLFSPLHYHIQFITLSLFHSKLAWCTNCRSSFYSHRPTLVSVHPMMMIPQSTPTRKRLYCFSNILFTICPSVFCFCFFYRQSLVLMLRSRLSRLLLVFERRLNICRRSYCTFVLCTAVNFQPLSCDSCGVEQGQLSTSYITFR